MLELPGICPVCWAFQDPITGKCLHCGQVWHITLQWDDTRAIAKNNLGQFTYVGKIFSS